MFIKLLLQLDPLLLELDELFGLLRPKVSPHELSISDLLLLLSHAVTLYLFLERGLVGIVILLPHHLVVRGNNILFFLLPSELLPLEVPSILDLVTLLQEPLIGLLVDLL